MARGGRHPGLPLPLDAAAGAALTELFGALTGRPAADLRPVWYLVVLAPVRRRH